MRFGLGFGVYASQINPARVIAQKLLSGENVLLVGIGDSKTAQEWYTHFSYASGLPIIGVGAEYQRTSFLLTSGVPWTSTKGTGSQVRLDGTLVSPYTQSAVSCMPQNMAHTFTAGSVASGYSSRTLQYLVAGGSYDASQHTVTRAAARGGTATALFAARKLGSSGQNGIVPWIRQFPAAVITLGAAVDVVSDNLVLMRADLPLSSGATGVDCALASPTTTTSGIIGCLGNTIWMGEGICHVCASVGGSTIERWLSSTLFSTAHMQLWSAMAAEMDATLIYDIDIGTNWVAGTTAAQWIDQMGTLAERLRAGSPGCLIMLGDDYPSSNSAGGVVPTYAVPDVTRAAASAMDAALFSTWHDLPSYEEGVALGYYGDVTHYNFTGKRAFAAAKGAKILAAAAA